MARTKKSRTVKTTVETTTVVVIPEGELIGLLRREGLIPNEGSVTIAPGEYEDSIDELVVTVSQVHSDSKEEDA